MNAHSVVNVVDYQLTGFTGLEKMVVFVDGGLIWGTYIDNKVVDDLEFNESIL